MILPPMKDPRCISSGSSVQTKIDYFGKSAIESEYPLIFSIITYSKRYKKHKRIFFNTQNLF